MSKQPAKRDELVERMDAAANFLLDSLKSTEGEDQDKVPLALRIDLFKTVTGWIAVRNKIEDVGEKAGGALDEYRSKLAAPEPGSDHQPALSLRERQVIGSAKGRANAVLARHGIVRPDGDGGPELDALKARVPGAVPRNHGGDFPGSGPAGVTIGRSPGKLHAGDVGGPGAVDK